MTRRVEPPVTFAALLLVASVLAGCTAVTVPEAAEPSLQPSATPTAVASAAGDCADPAWISISGMQSSLHGDLVDLGARELAAGTVGRDVEGAIVSYTVAPGDAPYAIGERLCIENPLVLAELNHTRTIHPEQVLRLDPDPSVPWIPYFNPDDAPAGFQQIPYQYAIEAMGAAADADELDTMRAIWNEELSAMFTDPRDLEVIQGALDVGDLAVLRQMFS